MAVNLDLFSNNDFLNIFMPILAIIVIISLVILTMYTVFMWRIFDKAGIEGWKILIPFYAQWCFNKIIFGNGWFMFINFASLFQYSNNSLISIMGSLILIGFGIAQMVMLARAFGKGTGFTVGLIFLPIVFLGILAFDNSEYQAKH
jgi:hypothetical protein